MRLSCLELLALLLVNLFALCIAQDVVHNYYWVIEETSVKMLCTERTVLTVNGSIPGPALNLTYGETVRVHVQNQATHGVTIHWHGVKQPRNPWSDGPEYITQCPIKPGSNFTYEVVLSDEEGTMWWHAHSDYSRSTVYGPIFIHPTSDRQYPYPIILDGQQQIILGSWIEDDVMEMLKQYMSYGRDFALEDALTINGMFNMVVEINKTYLLRIINAGMNQDMVFKVANHTLILVGSDAAYLKPINTDHVMIAPGQTMDVLLTANQDPGYYYMMARGTARGTRNTTGLLRYLFSTPPPVDPPLPDLLTINVADFTNDFRSLNHTNYPIDVPQGDVDRRIFITLSMNQDEICAGEECNIKSTASLNNVTYQHALTDVLQDYWSNISNVNTDFPDHPLTSFDYTNPDSSIGSASYANGTRVFVVKYNSTVEMVFQGTGLNPALAHPIHLHGYSFYQVANGTDNYDNTTAVYNLVNPPLINTVAVRRLGWAAVRFRADNPGVWFMHCHLERHAIFGMDTVMIVTNGTTEETSIRPPPYTLAPCNT